MSLNINIAIVSTVKTLEKDLESIRATLEKFPEFSATVSTPGMVRTISPTKGNPMRAPEENELREEYRNFHPLGKGFRMTHFLTHKYKGDALAALRGWKNGEWTLSQVGTGGADSVGSDAGEVEGEEY